jgi:hypothetical protein
VNGQVGPKQLTLEEPGQTTVDALISRALSVVNGHSVGGRARDVLADKLHSLLVGARFYRMRETLTRLGPASGSPQLCGGKRDGKDEMTKGRRKRFASHLGDPGSRQGVEHSPWSVFSLVS